MFSAASNIIIADIIKFFFVFSIDRFSLSVKHSAWGDDTELLGFSCNYFKLHRLEATSDTEEVSFFDWSVSVFEVGDEVGFGEVTLEAFNCVCEGEHVDFGQIWNVSGRFDLDNISESHPKIFSDGFVHSNFPIFEFVINESDNQGFFSLLALDEDGVAFENFEFAHLGLTELNGRVLIVEGLFNLSQRWVTRSLLGAFFWSRMAVETSFFGSIR